MKENKKKDSPRTEVNKAKLLQHLKQQLGNVRKACTTSGVTKSTFYDWNKNDDNFKRAVLNIYRGCENMAITRIMDLVSDDVEALVKIQKKAAKRIK
ncbi:MAG: hypothetical protein EOP48_18105 [Sphingobacteriales bacterium]|nr:MAG: hypothetical protein EOP48_18105 [Sphingobacteriales bacterium]